MSDYSRNYDFSVKDGLSTGNPAKLIKGSEVDDELDDVATASATKIDKPSSPTEGDVLQYLSGTWTDSSDAVVSQILTNQGDLVREGASGAERVALGTAGQKFVSDGTDAVWASTGWEYVDKLDAFDGTTQAEFTDLESNYEHLFEFRNLRAETDSLIQTRTSTNNGSTYDSGATDYITSYFYSHTGTSTVDGAVPAQTGMYISAWPIESTDTNLNGLSGQVLLMNLESGAPATVIAQTGGWREIGTYGSTYGVSQRRDGTAVDAIEFSMVTDQIDEGAIYHYRKKVGS